MPVFDIEGLATRERSTPAIQKLRTPHHELARLLALGLKDVEVSRLTGYSQSRICILKTDPMFANLVNYYSTARDESAIDVRQRLQAAAITAVEVLQERMEGDDVDKISSRDLRQIAEMGLDRTGFGPTSTSLNVNLTSAKTIQEIKELVEKESRGRVVPRNQITLISQDNSRAAGGDSADPAPTGIEGEGSPLREADERDHIPPLAAGDS